MRGLPQLPAPTCRPPTVLPIVQVVSRWTKIEKRRTSKAEAMSGLKAQPRPYSSSARPAEPAYPLVAGVAVPPLHRSDKEPPTFPFLGTASRNATGRASLSERTRIDKMTLA
ncbi:hypothetical protein PUN28_000861 [Cardiocondyla obscurior]|uniref:Uncharacterized protein n=1 Tax=Cardiocondyla obscurior TaxID=286306 RepID=A0AAW2H1V6_9HYME